MNARIWSHVNLASSCHWVTTRPWHGPLQAIIIWVTRLGLSAHRAHFLHEETGCILLLMAACIGWVAENGCWVWEEETVFPAGAAAVITAWLSLSPSLPATMLPYKRAANWVIGEISFHCEPLGWDVPLIRWTSLDGSMEFMHKLWPECPVCTPLACSTLDPIGHICCSIDRLVKADVKVFADGFSSLEPTQQPSSCTLLPHQGPCTQACLDAYANMLCLNEDGHLMSKSLSSSLFVPGWLVESCLTGLFRKAATRRKMPVCWSNKSLRLWISCIIKEWCIVTSRSAHSPHCFLSIPSLPEKFYSPCSQRTCYTTVRLMTQKSWSVTLVCQSLKVQVPWIQHVAHRAM